MSSARRPAPSRSSGASGAGRLVQIVFVMALLFLVGYAQARAWTPPPGEARRSNDAEPAASARLTDTTGVSSSGRGTPPRTA